jgi:enoyl-[acyl-carrier-protein] reductase (NADH)
MGNATQATARSIEEQKAEIIQTQSQIKISKRITELKNENIELIQIYNQQDNLQKMSNNI